ncbi:MAG: hypothetical protein M1354_00305 [Candidatus Marsarchaeota archaeon]|jgi:hypothetical protein|nr:hypothetical protein [Candidatus Marsarchaeota archaeon]
MENHGYPRLQSAMEYLITYGWAILILAVVLAVIFTLNLFNAPQTCVLGSGLSCPRYAISQQGILNVTIVQTTSGPINVTGIGCGQGASPPIEVISEGVINSSSSRAFTVQCYSSSGSPFASSASSEFKGSLVVKYHDQYTGYPHTVSGILQVRISGTGEALSTTTT